MTLSPDTILTEPKENYTGEERAIAETRDLILRLFEPLATLDAIKSWDTPEKLSKTFALTTEDDAEQSVKVSLHNALKAFGVTQEAQEQPNSLKSTANAFFQAFGIRLTALQDTPENSEQTQTLLHIAYQSAQKMAFEKQGQYKQTTEYLMQCT